METFNQRLKRFLDEDELEIFGWMTVYLQNDYRNELIAARQARRFISVYLLSHAVIQTISENLFGIKGNDGTVFFLKHFVDDVGEPTPFSDVVDELHNARNVMAHQGYSGLQHSIDYFAEDLCKGWTRESGYVRVNPELYSKRFEKAIIDHRWIKEFKRLPESVRLVRKYRFIRQWLRVPPGDSIAVEINGLSSHETTEDQSARVQRIRALIYARFGLE